MAQEELKSLRGKRNWQIILWGGSFGGVRLPANLMRDEYGCIAK